MLNVDSMGMQFKGLGGAWGLVATRGQRSCLIDSIVSYLFLQGPRWRDGGKGDTEGGKKDEKNGDMETFLRITYKDKVSDTESIPKAMVRVLLHVGM